jgi:NADPH:quinone reductase-like Zn-dependent oxidoreductase
MRGDSSTASGSSPSAHPAASEPTPCWTKALGADVSGVCSTAKLDLVRSLGADQVMYSDLERLSAYIESGAVTPSIDRDFSLDRAVDAMQLLIAGQVKGKITLTI